VSLRILFRPEAAADVAEAWSWYEARERGLGDEFVRCLDAVLGRAARNAEEYPVVHRDVRRGVIRRFPYAVFYAERGPHLVVFAVFHAKRDPTSWRSRVD
jgi:plasmid stabilization system protein ParE